MLVTRNCKTGEVQDIELTKEETQELLETGYVESEEGFCITCTDTGITKELRVYKSYRELKFLKLWRDK